MSFLDHPEAQVLLAPEAVRGCEGRLAAFLGRYLPRFRRAEQRANATLVIRGPLGGLQRKTCGPIAVEAGVHRKPIQFLVGAGRWDDEAVMAEVRRHVTEDLGDDRAVLVIDATTFPKPGADSRGVGRQWSGRLGKRENYQRGIFLAYAAPGGYAPLDRRLYLPKDWAGDAARRARCHVPEDVEFREGWRIAAELIGRSGPGLPAGRRVRLTIRPGEKGPIAVDAMAVRVRTRPEYRLGPEERLVVMRTAEAEPEIHHALGDAAADVPPEELVRARFARHKIEEVFDAAKGEVGLAQLGGAEPGVGWHHHVTLSMLAL